MYEYLKNNIISGKIYINNNILSFYMQEIISAISHDSDAGQNITENEWNKIKNTEDKNNILSSILSSKLKVEFNKKYKELDDFFQHEWDQIHKTTVNELRLFREVFDWSSDKNFKIKNELISRYSTEYKDLQWDVITFLEQSFNNKFNNELWDFNINKFDNKDNQEWFSKYELDQYIQLLDKAMRQMNVLGWYEEFQQKCIELWEEPSFLSWKGDIALANAVDIQEYIFWESEKHLTGKIHNYSEEELHIMREEKFDITESDKMKNFLILLGIELWDWIEDALKFVWNIPAGIVLLPRYISNRITLSDSVVDTQEEVEAQIENDRLLKENPSLVLWELLWEKWIQMIKQLWDMFISWKNWDIATVLVSIVWLLAWWAWAVKIWTKIVRKNAIKNARKAGIEWRDIHWRNIRNKLKDWANSAENIQNKLDKIDDIIWWAWLGHLIWNFNSSNNQDSGYSFASNNENLNKADQMILKEHISGKHRHDFNDSISEYYINKIIEPWMRLKHPDYPIHKIDVVRVSEEWKIVAIEMWQEIKINFDKFRHDIWFNNSTIIEPWIKVKHPHLWEVEVTRVSLDWKIEVTPILWEKEYSFNSLIESNSLLDSAFLEEYKNIIKLKESWELSDYLTDTRAKNMQAVRDQLITWKYDVSLSKDEYYQYFSQEYKQLGKWLSQWNTWNCYLVATLDALSYSPYFELMMRTSLNRLPNWEWEVKIPLMDPNWETVIITPQELKAYNSVPFLKRNSNNINQRINPISANEWYKVLEAAFIKHSFWQVDRLKAEWWVWLHVMQKFVWDFFNTNEITAEDRLRGFSTNITLELNKKIDSFLKSYNPDIDIVTLWTKKELTDIDNMRLVSYMQSPVADKKIKKQGQTQESLFITANNKPLYTGHAYSLKWVDFNNDQVFVSNPWNTNETITLTIEEFKDSFSNIDITKIDDNRVLQNMYDIEEHLL